MVRNGIPYGPEFEGFENQERGLLFACYQSELDNSGFRFVTTTWLNNPNFPVDNAGFDLFTSQPGKKNPQSNELEQMRITLNETKGANTFVFNYPNGLQPLVTMKGGEYFFVPSLKALSQDFQLA